MAESMKERPILFSGPMIRAILEGRKTHTRRVIKSPCKDEHGQPSKGPFKWVETPEGFSACLDLSGDGYDENGCQISFCCPYGVPGDRLWARETWAEFNEVDQFDDLCSGYYYRATEEEDDGIKWRPSIHMPRSVSRITLEVTGVRAERLQDISEEDAKAEGFRSVMEFSQFWDSLAKPGAKWIDNPWVLVIEFRRAENDQGE